MRIRTIKPEFWQHEILAQLPEFTRLLAIGLLNYADDEGYFYASPQSIRGAVFPFLDDSGRITVALRELSNVGYIELGKCPDGRAVGRVAKFRRHQVINKPAPTKIGPFSVQNEDCSNTTVGLPESSGSDTVGLPPGMEQGKEVEQGTGNRERNGKSGKPDAAAVEILDFLNVKAGRQFRHTDENLKLITARLKSVDGDAAGIRAMIERQVKLWGDDPKMSGFLRPETLFGKEKFGGYYDLRAVPVVPEHGQSRRPGGHADHLHPEHIDPTPALF